MILKLEQFCNEKGMSVSHRTLVEGPPAPFHQFVGNVGYKVGDDIQMIEFAIDADTIQEAFANFKEAADAKVAKLRKEQEKTVEEEFKKPVVGVIPAGKKAAIRPPKPKSNLILPG